MNEDKSDIQIYADSDVNQIIEKLETNSYTTINFKNRGELHFSQLVSTINKPNKIDELLFDLLDGYYLNLISKKDCLISSIESDLSEEKIESPALIKVENYKYTLTFIYIGNKNLTEKDILQYIKNNKLENRPLLIKQYKSEKEILFYIYNKPSKDPYYSKYELKKLANKDSKLNNLSFNNQQKILISFDQNNEIYEELRLINSCAHKTETKFFIYGMKDTENKLTLFDDNATQNLNYIRFEKSKIYVSANENSTIYQEIKKIAGHTNFNQILYSEELSNQFLGALIDIINNKLISKITIYENKRFFDAERTKKISEAAENNPYLESIRIKKDNGDNYQEVLNKKIISRNKKLCYQSKQVTIENNNDFLFLETIKRRNLNEWIAVLEINYYDDTLNFDELISYIGSYSELQSLRLSGKIFGDEFFSKICELENTNNLKQLFINNTRITTKSIRSILDMLENTADLGINLENNKEIDFNDDLFCKELAKTWKFKSQTLIWNNIFEKPIELEIGKNILKFSFVLEFILKLIKEKKVKILDLTEKKYINWPQQYTEYKNSLNEKDFGNVISTLLTKNSTIIRLTMAGDSTYSTDQIKVLANLLEKNECNLAFLDILGCAPLQPTQGHSISNERVIPLINCLKENKTLIGLTLSGNFNIDSAIIENLQSGLLKNNTLLSLDLSNTNIDEGSLKKMLTTLAPTKKNAPRNNSLCNLKVSNIGNTINNKDYNKNALSILNQYNTTNSGKKMNFIFLIENSKTEEIEKYSKTASIYNRDEEEGNYLLHLTIKYIRLDVVKLFVCKLGYNLELTNKKGQTPLQMALDIKNNLNGEPNRELDSIIDILKNPTISQSKINTSPKAKNDSLKRKEPTTRDNSELPNSKKTKVNSSEKQVNGIPLNGKSSKIKSSESEEDEEIFSSKSMQIEKKSNSSKFSDNDELFNAVVLGNDYQFEKMIKNSNLINIRDEAGNTLLHIAVKYNHLKIVKLLLLDKYKLDCNIVNDDERTPLLELIYLLYNGEYLLKNQTETMLIAKALIDRGAELNGYILHKSIQIGNYCLMKIILDSPKCDINEKGDNNYTPLMWAIHKQDEKMVARLLIDRRLTREVIEEALEEATKLEKSSVALSFSLPENSLKKIIARLKWRLQVELPEPRCGIQWVKSHTLFYGASPEKPQKTTQINSDKELAYLAMQNSYTKTCLTKNEDTENPEALLKNLGNPVTASLIFVISKGVYIPHQAVSRTKICVALDFKETHHLSDADIEKIEVEKIIKRASSAPEEAFEETFPQRKGKAVHPADIKDKHKNSNFDYNQRFHHGEQSLMDDLEREETVDEIIKKLMSHSKFIKGMKIYAVILNIYSPRYPCENCEISLLGEQNEKKSLFLSNLSKELKNSGCVLPVFSSLRMITQISSHIVHNSDQITPEEHKALAVDIRDCKNNLILVKDESCFGDNATQYHSNQSNNNK